MSRLALRRLTLSHFRSHARGAFGFAGAPVAIHGPNGSGKTNLIEAISLLSPGRGLRGAAAEEMARLPERIGWKIAAELEAPSGTHEVVTWSEGAGRRVELDGKAAAQAALGAVARVLWLTPAMDRLWLEGAAERRRFLDRATLSLLPEHGAAALAYDRALRERGRLLREGVRDPGWYAALEARLAEEGARIDAGRRAALARLGAAPETPGFPRGDLALIAEGPRDPAGLRAALAEGRARDLAAGRTGIGPHRDDLGAVYAAKGMEARLCSTGEQKALLIGVVLANAWAVAEDFGAPPLLLLDEVAAHLDADRRRALYGAIAGLGAQAFLTGTGPELFEGLEGERLAL
ncbi:DNA replication/repair protein RecF [Amaricoccus solimangrovi]|uniref:DNA replication and repair protein RecF n=1 Tax=Amaricoccus solimangrovi TaxID=2589815 RepID=A0A501WMY7_9RHOB|nr:DNA replication/repair protein RecF [Amaricoccus solimangrovi]TPE49705.1 DNA replication/repair protein RecF [Amaricoccus solimangrovi]